MGVMGMIKEGEHIGVRALRANLAGVLKSSKTYFVTDHGKPVRAVVDYEVLLELLDIIEEMKDTSLIRDVAKGREEYGSGGFVPVDRLKKAFKKTSKRR